MFYVNVTILFFLFIFQPVAFAATQKEKAVIAIREAQHRLMESEALWVEYDQTRRSIGGEKVTASYKNGWKKEWLFLHDYGRSDSKKKRETVSVWRDDCFFQRAGRQCQVSSEFSSTFRDKMFYFYTTGLDAFGHIEEKQLGLKKLTAALGKALPFEIYEPSLLKTLSTHSDFHVRAVAESVDGFSCMVLERSGKEIIWLDQQHLACCRKRQYFQSPNSLIGEIHNRDFQEVSDGIWLPFSQETKRYHWDTGPVELRGQVNYVEENRVTELIVGDVGDDRFEVPLPKKGGYMVDHIRGITYTLHRNGIKAEEAITKAVSDASERLGNAHRAYQIRNKSNNRRLAILANVAVVLLIIALLQLRRQKSL